MVMFTYKAKHTHYKNYLKFMCSDPSFYPALVFLTDPT